MKKILAMLLALVMIFALAACGQQAAPAASNDAPAAAEGGNDWPAPMTSPSGAPTRSSI